MSDTLVPMNVSLGLIKLKFSLTKIQVILQTIIFRQGKPQEEWSLSGQGIAEPRNLINNKLGKNHSGEKFAEIRTYAGCFSRLYLYNGIALCIISIVCVHITVAALLWIQFHYFHTCSPQIVEMQPGFWSPFSFPASAPALQCCTPFSLKLMSSSLEFIAMALSVRERSANIRGPSMEIYNLRRKIQCICAKVHPICMKSFEMVMHAWVYDRQI